MGTVPKASGADLIQSILERRIAANRALGDLEQSILGSLKSFSDQATKSMDELVRLNLPSEAERQAAERVREEVLKLTADLVRDLERRLPRTGSGSGL
jgi:hypothetical protein